MTLSDREDRGLLERLPFFELRPASRYQRSNFFYVFYTISSIFQPLDHNEQFLDLFFFGITLFWPWFLRDRVSYLRPKLRVTWVICTWYTPCVLWAPHCSWLCIPNFSLLTKAYAIEDTRIGRLLYMRSYSYNACHFFISCYRQLDWRCYANICNEPISNPLQPPFNVLAHVTPKLQTFVRCKLLITTQSFVSYIYLHICY